uniref:Uncharacterized protein n=1 Tax=Oryza meridionalis TaxID=40149 RepID=A0A0E0FDB7_9ORYZ
MWCYVRKSASSLSTPQSTPLVTILAEKLAPILCSTPCKEMASCHNEKTDGQQPTTQQAPTLPPSLNAHLVLLNFRWKYRRAPLMAHFEPVALLSLILLIVFCTATC